MHTILILVIVLSLLIFAHEFGHFITAKLSKAKVEEFGFGFPPRIFGVKRGETVYSVNWIPLGGFVKIKGESGAEAKDPDSFASKPFWQRAIIVCAGVVMNLVLAWFLLSIGFIIGLPAAIEDLPAHAVVSDHKIQVLSVLPDSAADQAGLEVGDTVLTLNGQAPESVDWFQNFTGSRQGQAIVVGYSRSGEESAVTLKPEMISQTGRPGLGIAIIETGVVSYPFWLAPVQAAGAVWYFLKEVAYAFFVLIRDLIIAKPVPVEFSGPVGIAVLTAEVSALGFRYLLQFTALLSVNLAVINILPFPALDGGRLVFLLAERIRRKPISPRIEAAVHNLGFVLLLALVAVITYRDIIKFGDRLRQTFGG